MIENGARPRGGATTENGARLCLKTSRSTSDGPADRGKLNVSEDAKTEEKIFPLRNAFSVDRPA